MDCIKLKLYILDTLKIDSPQHQTFKAFSQNSFSIFPTIIATKLNQNNEESIQLLTTSNLQPFSINKLKDYQQKILSCFDILKAIWFLHQKQYYLGSNSFQKILLYSKQQKNLKTKHYLALPITSFNKNSQTKKDKQTAKNGIQLSLNVERTAAKLDLWRWASFTAQLLFTFSLQKYIQKALQCQKLEQFVPQIEIKTKFLGCEQLKNMLQRCLKILPKSRPQIDEVILTFKKPYINSTIHVNSETIKISQQTYKKQEEKVRAEMSIQIAQDIILTEEVKKKLANYFVLNTKKAPKSYKPVYRATRFQFNPRVFYEQCAKLSKLLFVINTEDSGVIGCYIEVTINLCEEGFAGGFIADPSLKSFIFSIKNQESYKLVNKDKAFKSVPGYGPIIGDGDIILGTNKGNNWCYFPKSYQTGKQKKLMAKTQFSITNYDVYQIIF